MKTARALLGILTLTCVLSFLTGCGSGGGEIVERTTSLPGGGGPATVESEHSFDYSLEQNLKAEWESVVYLDSKREAHPNGPGLIQYTVRYKVKGKKSQSSAGQAPRGQVAASKPKEMSPTERFRLQAETIGMLGPTVGRLGDSNLSDSELRESLRKSPRLRELASEHDLRILAAAKDPRPTTSEWPVAYLLFKRDNLTDGISALSSDGDFCGYNVVHMYYPYLESGFGEAMADDSETIDKPSVQSGWVYHFGQGNGGQWEPCNAVGWAVCREITGGKNYTRINSSGSSPKVLNEDPCQGFWCAYSNRPIYFLLIEVGSPLHKWIMSAPYHTNLFSTPTRGETSAGKTSGSEQQASSLVSQRNASPPPIPAPAALGNQGDRWTNSLGMIFTPVARARVWFSIWATRHKDFAALPNSSQGEYAFGDPKRVATLPATDIDWNQAVEFCNWLTKKERSEGLLNNAQSYRLPSDFEWSVAVGLENEDEAASVTERMRKANDSFPEGNPSDGIYPWGKGYPPPDGVGNYGKEKASVGHYPPNRYGLYDMGGNVEEWCQDTLDWGQGVAIIRGIAATFASTPREKASASRYTVGFDNKSSNRGFRCVLVTKSLH